MPLRKGDNEVEMEAIANLLPVIAMGAGIFFFFRWVVRDMNRPAGQ